MKRRNLAAYTVQGCSYPAFLSIDQDDAGIHVVVRSAAAGPEIGAQASITIPALDFVGLVRRVVDLGAL